MGREKIDLQSAIDLYETGKYTIKQIGEMQGVCTGTMYYALRDAGCRFIRKRRHPMSDEERQERRKRLIGRVMSEAQKRMISERNSCNFNGMNGYGHTKNQCRGYVLAYVPKHPHATKDGYVMLHTILMEIHIGRYLNDDEVVHHINHNRSDNRIENLQLMKKKEHMSMHMKERHAKRRGSPLT